MANLMCRIGAIVLALSAVAALAGCDDASSPDADPVSFQDAGIMDMESVTDTAAPDAEIEVDMMPPIIDECATDNGGCGDPELYDCMDPPDGPPICSLDPTNDYLQLVQGVSVIESSDALPDNIVVHGRNAFPLLLDERGRAFGAAARFGEGKIMVLGHEGHIGGFLTGPGHSGQLLSNALEWMAGEGSLRVAATGGLGDLAGFLEDREHQVRVANLTDLSDIDVLCVSSYIDFTPEVVERIHAFVRGGGGLVVGGQAWWWAYSTGGVPVLGYPGNRLMNDLGMTMGGLGEIEAQSDTVSPEPPSALHHAAHALDALFAHVSDAQGLEVNDLVLASETVSIAMRVLSLDHPWFIRARTLLEVIPPPAPSTDDPIRPGEDPIARVRVSLESRLANEGGVDDLPTIEAATAFPGAVDPEAEVVEETITIDARYTGRSHRYAFANAGSPVWRSTGLYLAPGAVLTVRAPATAIEAGLDILIGCHTDELWGNDEWRRYPRITRAWPIAAEVTRAGNAFGGPVYIRVPIGADAGMIDITIEGAIRMPHYVHGEMNNEEWIRTERNRLAPWAELESSKFILTVPADQIHDLEDPEGLMNFWDEVLDAAADLATIDRERARPERFVLDRQLSGGWMHSGYPLMAYVVASWEFLDVARVREEGIWGPFHEIGHNHQFYDTVLPGTTEATVNLWSVYINEGILGRDRNISIDALVPEDRAQRMADYLATGPDFAQWSVWTALETYLQLQEGFGWDFYKDLFAEYLMIPDAEAPYEDADRINEWVVRSSRRAGVDLGPFYEAWGLPMSEAARAEMATLPEWAENPM